MKGEPWRPWSTRDDHRLIVWHEQGISDAEIGRRLGRATGGVACRRRKLGEVAPPSWSEADETLLRELFDEGKSDAEIAVQMGRTKTAVKSRRGVLGIVADIRFTDEQKALVKRLFPTTTGKQLGAMIGKTDQQIYRLAARLGLSKGRHWTKSERNELAVLIRAKHPLQWVDREIAAAWNAKHPDLPVSRELVTEVRRRKCRLPHNAFSNRSRRKVAAKTKEQLKKAGLKSLAEVRCQAFADFAARQGWPGVSRPRCVQILNLLYEKGPHTRQQIAAALGLSWNPCKHKPRGFGLRGNGPGGTYTAELCRLGLVVRLGRKVKTGPRKGSHCQLYAIAPGVVRGPISQRSEAS
jgi:hypothetical protein